MYPKAKAKELFDKYQFVEIQNYSSKHEVKDCALIAVEEIIDYMTDVMKWDEETNGNILYWDEVKDEIKLL